MRDDDTNYEEIVKKHGGRLLVIEPPKNKGELQYGNILFKTGDLVRTNYPWYITLPVQQGIIKGFSEFHYNGECVPAVEIELPDGEIYKTPPSNIEKVDDSWLDLC